MACIGSLCVTGTSACSTDLQIHQTQSVRKQLLRVANSQNMVKLHSVNYRVGKTVRFRGPPVHMTNQYRTAALEQSFGWKRYVLNCSEQYTCFKGIIAAHSSAFVDHQTEFKDNPLVDR